LGQVEGRQARFRRLRENAREPVSISLEENALKQKARVQFRFLADPKQ
jgi:hypothetical protein